MPSHECFRKGRRVISAANVSFLFSEMFSHSNLHLSIPKVNPSWTCRYRPSPNPTRTSYDHENNSKNRNLLAQHMLQNHNLTTIYLLAETSKNGHFHPTTHKLTSSTKPFSLLGLFIRKL